MPQADVMGAPGGSGRRRLVPRVVIALAVLAVVGGVAYVGIGVYGYTQLATVAAKCPSTEDFVDVQEPTAFTARTTVNGVRVDVDTAPYLMPAPVDVSFPARDEAVVTIAAWWEPVAAPDAPTVIVSHGINGCRRNSGNLLVAGMLHRAGIAVLLIDLRNHGDSTVVDGRFSGGNTEYRDVLGAFDWLQAQGVPARRIGLFGFSGGAIASMVSIGEEPAVAAIWADSSFTTAREVFHDGATNIGLPGFLDGAPLLAGWLLSGRDLMERTPLAATEKLGGRPIALTQGALDERLNPAYLGRLAEAVRAAGGSPVVWQVPDAHHTQAHFLHPTEYDERVTTFFLGALEAT